MYFHLLRSHAILNAVLESHAEQGLAKFETFVTLKWTLSDTDFLYRTVEPLALSYWRLYRTREDTFPLGDSTILVERGSTMVALSPRLLLEISTNRRTSEYQWDLRNGIKPGKLAEYRKRTIASSFREVIFSDRPTLEFWRHTREFEKRVAALRDMSSYRALMAEQLAIMKWPI